MAESDKGTAERDPSSGDLPEGWYLDERGQLCHGTECLTVVIEEEGIAFDLDPEKCDPKTREALVGAAIRGARLRFK